MRREQVKESALPKQAFPAHPEAPSSEGLGAGGFRFDGKVAMNAIVHKPARD